MSEVVTLCQYCLDRGLEPNEAIGLYNKLPICDPCLGPIMDNKSDAPDTETRRDETIEDRKTRALELLDEFEALFERWPLTADETLLSHGDFYNHRPPAIVNCSLEEIQAIYSRRKGILYAIRHKDERWYTDIENLKRKQREQANLTGIAKSTKVYGSKKSPIGDEAKAKLAKKLGISIAQLDAMGKESREKEFIAITGTSPANPVKDNIAPASSVKSILSNLQNTVKSSEVKKVKRDFITGKVIE